MSYLPDLLIELGCEELPARMVQPAAQGLKDAVLNLIAGVPYESVHVFATPRRIAVAVENLESATPVVEREILGPPADKAFGPDGAPTPTGLAFAVSKGADPATLRIVEVPKRGAVAAVLAKEGGVTVDVLVRDGLADIISKLPFPKTMIWGDGGLSFGRPLHRILAIYDGNTIEGEAHGIRFGHVTTGHRLTPEPIIVGNLNYWQAGLRAHHVEPSVEARRTKIQALLDAAATELEADPIVNDELLDEVTNLVEWPTAVIGRFDEDLLELPPRLLVTSMRVHQRYFPVYRQGQLTNRFVVISNNPFADEKVVAEGNARVLRARFYDARFFLSEDRSKRLEQHGEKLVSMRWIRGLGTMADKAGRMAAQACGLMERLGADGPTVGRAATLSKCDLPSQMVGEFPELQGHMGRLYATYQGETDAVALAIEEHYLPRSAGDALPTSPVGRALAIGDRLDTLVGCFGIGQEPKGGGDPQGLRRAALAVINLLLDAGISAPLRTLFTEAVAAFHGMVRQAAGPELCASAEPAAKLAKAFPSYDAWIAARGLGEQATGEAELVGKLVDFALARFKAAQVDRGRSPDLVDAVLAVAGDDPDPVVLAAKLDALAAVAGTERFAPILVTFKRLLNILGDEVTVAQVAESIPDGAERALAVAARDAGTLVAAFGGRNDWSGALDAAVSLSAPVDAFFEAVMVNDPDPGIRARRLGILGSVAGSFRSIADFSRISTR